MANFQQTFSRHKATLAKFPRWRDRGLYLYGRILRRLAWPLPGRNSISQIRLHDYAHPFHVRLSSTDWLVLEEIFLNGEYAFVSQAVKDPVWIVDLGANVGYSLRYWHCLFPDARVIAMEPDPTNCEICRRNIVSSEKENKVKLLQAAVGARHGQLRLVDVGEGEWAYRTVQNESSLGTLVDVVPLVEVLEKHTGNQQVDLLKCDIEGAERELFADCKPWIDRVNAIVIEIHPPYTLADLQSALAKAGAEFDVVFEINQKLCPVVMLRRRMLLP